MGEFLRLVPSRWLTTLVLHRNGLTRIIPVRVPPQFTTNEKSSNGSEFAISPPIRLCRRSTVVFSTQPKPEAPHLSQPHRDMREAFPIVSKVRTPSTRWKIDQPSPLPTMAYNFFLQKQPGNRMSSPPTT